MDLKINLEKPEATFTNGDTISGDVVLYCSSKISLSRIRVWLNGESALLRKSSSKTFDLGNNSRESCTIFEDSVDAWPQPYTTNHKPSKQGSLSLGAGYYSFPFRLQIPWFVRNEPSRSRPSTPIARALGLESASKKAELLSTSCELPPSVKDDAGTAEVNYRITAIATQGSVFKKPLQRRQQICIWPLDTRTITYQQSEFPCTTTQEATILGIGASSDRQTQNNSSHQPANLFPLSHLSSSAQILVTASLPAQCALTCNSPLSMRLSLCRTNAFMQPLYLQSFQLMLVGYTDIAIPSANANGIGTPKFTVSSWTLQSGSNLNRCVFTGNEAVHSITELNSLWEGKALPKDVVPSFESTKFNRFSRRYELDILLGFQYTSKKSRLMLTHLRIPVTLHSGLRPAHLLSIPSNASSLFPASSSQKTTPRTSRLFPPTPPLYLPSTHTPPITLSNPSPRSSLAQYERAVHSLLDADIDGDAETVVGDTEGVKGEQGNDGPRVVNSAGVQSWLERFEYGGGVDSWWSVDTDVDEKAVYDSSDEGSEGDRENALFLLEGRGGGDVESRRALR